MSSTPAPIVRTTTLNEEIANTISHGIGLLAALIAVPFLLLTAIRHHDVLSIVSASVFGATIILLFAASTLYHAVLEGKAKYRFELLDHAAIFLLIAGTYTPFTLAVLRGAWGWSLFGTIWALALLGIVLTLVSGMRYPVLTVGLYLGMGWLGVIAMRPLSYRMPMAGLLLILAGGVAYTVGVAFYSARRMPYNHLVWHLFVIMGTAFHYLAVVWYAA